MLSTANTRLLLRQIYHILENACFDMGLVRFGLNVFDRLSDSTEKLPGIISLVWHNRFYRQAIYVIVLRAKPVLRIRFRRGMELLN